MAANEAQDGTRTSGGGAAPTVSHLLGEMTWLLTQSPLHRALAIGDLEWLVMPALIHQQFYVFRESDKPVGLALWAKCSAAAAAKLERGMIEPENRLSLEEWNSGGQVWLVDLIAPFATTENRHREIMIADLVSKPLAGTEFRFHQTDPATGKRTVQVVGADAGEKLKEALIVAAGGIS
ncbi:toxin-activating lysine-acyltransferase [Sphingomonas psychrotolerans]|uniref:RTX toxin-activating lysine-acyltransferase n=1 Tax=Sphingomonas psychrotolerans TaxID=1327635 RepID=A0ABU3N8U8_9SPHN|nr:toxin-activating lysine-acyltransferase [Sphingomonas psychrotolerans]MDT8760217.1 toxin-activating lysine-acyltransferase [Sphingomonas psychrotolerans]